MLVRPVMKRLFFPWKTRKKKGSFRSRASLSYMIHMCIPTIHPFFLEVRLFYVNACFSSHFRHLRHPCPAPPYSRYDVNSRNPCPGSNGRLFSHLTIVRGLAFCNGEKDSALSSLVDSRRIVPTDATIQLLL